MMEYSSQLLCIFYRIVNKNCIYASKAIKAMPCKLKTERKKKSLSTHGSENVVKKSVEYSESQ